MKFKLISDYRPAGDQPRAIDNLTSNVLSGAKNQVLLGVTGSGKTYTMANVIANVQKPTLIISHNKTLAGQLYQEFRDFFPENAVSYFVSYYDYYQPEAYIPQTDTYIEKESEINEEIDKLRLAATTNLLTRKDTIVVASVSCIYNLGSPVEYGRYILEIREGMKIKRDQIANRLVDLQYTRSDFGFHRGSFRIKGDTIDVFPAYEDFAIRLEFLELHLQKIRYINPLTGDYIKNKSTDDKKSTAMVIYPAKHYMTNPNTYKNVFAQIRRDLDAREKELIAKNKTLEAHRLRQKTEYDLEMIQEIGYCNGIENYSRYFDGRNPGDSPYTLLNYFPRDFLLFIDESHMTVPQIRGMYNGDKARKNTLIDYGFRLPSALDNRPLRFDEFVRRLNQTIFVSATPSQYEISLAKENGEKNVVEQLVRPTGLVDPEVMVFPSKGQINHLIKQINIRVKKKERVLITTLTKKMAEELSYYLKDQGIKVEYLHSDIETLDRSNILDKLRLGEFDVLVGINLLREGLDLPEVSLVVIMDADKEGFLRSDVSLIQTMGRAARNLNSQVFMYADNTTGSMRRAIDEVLRRRKVQLEYNFANKIIPKQIFKPVRKRLVEEQNKPDEEVFGQDPLSLIPENKIKLIKTLNSLMKQAAKDMDFEEAAKYRDEIKRLNNS
jgi:excinuclease ABC subunit B